MIRRDQWRPPVGQHIYKPTDKGLPDYSSFGNKEEAYYVLSQRIEGKLGPEGGTTMEIYRNVTSPLGLTSSQTIELLRGAKKEGYLE